ncbi:AKNA factor, partial [Sapayoa aenigma]|nr:AKNA factor [Sapayoa aenigma]
SPSGVLSPQDDYHKLLTKYAEAENTIDQLRLGARVSLFADPPQPSRSLSVGTVGTGCRVMTLSIPQARMAALGMAADTVTATASPAPAPGPSEEGDSPQPQSPPVPRGGCPTCPGLCCCPGPRLTRALAGQSRRLQAQARMGGLQGRAGVESFESWLCAGSPTPSEQLQRMRLLKDAQDALEREYLRGRQQLPGTPGGFDPDRAVEEEIYRLGLRLEGLKERLEPGGRRQPPPQRPPQPSLRPPPQPCCAPAPPVLVEGALGTTGDSEGVMGGLPWPLWHKQLQVEEEFGDLLEQYKHLKSLPESLSLEQLSLAGSGSQEEVDASAPRDSSPSKVPCRTQSLEEGADLKTFPMHPLERRAAPLPHTGSPKAEGMRGHPSPATTEEVPATAKPTLGVPGPPQAPLSRRSSGTGSAATQHRPCKVSPMGPHLQAPPGPAGDPGVLSTHPALPVHVQEQRIVSPETDSGFVGSEASRVSPPMHTPEHRPPGTGTPGSLGPSILIPTTLCTPQKREKTPLPSETVVMGPPGRQGGTGGPCLPPSTPSQSSSPPRWAESTGSEAGPDPDGDGSDTPMSHSANPGSLCSPSSPAHMDSDRSCASASSHPAATARSPPSPLPSPETPSPTLLSPDLPSLDPANCDLLGSRLERDQAIWELRDEVWRLRRRLEESLCRSRSYPEGKATPRVAPGRRRPVGSGPSSPKDAAPSRNLSPPVRGRVAPGVAPTRRGRSASLPQDRPELDLTSESDPSPAGPRAPPSLQKNPGSPLGAVTFRGQYTGTRYQVGTPRAAPAPREKPGTPGCPQCRRSRTSSGGFWGGDATQQPQYSTPRKVHCPTCQAPMGPPMPGSSDRVTHERGPGGTSTPGSHVDSQAKKPEQPGFWYLAASPAATAATICLAPVPVVPYVPSML